MAIAKKPNRNRNEISPDEERAAAFITGAAQTPAPENDETKKTPVMMRFDREVLKRVDAAAKRRGISRSAWIQFTVSRALDQGEG